jgi:vacuolar-type H+-ATPase subunit E/Vma4
MPLENILQALEAEAERQVAEIEQAARDEIERIRAQAQTKAAAVRQKHMAAIQSPLQAERARILNQAKLEALRVVMGTRETLIASALEAAARCLASLPTTQAYAGLLQRLAQEAVNVLGASSRLRLRVQSCDVELMSRIVQETGLPATVEGGLESEASLWGSLGGLIATTPDARISLVNTLDARLGRVASLYRGQIAEMVLGDGQEG